MKPNWHMDVALNVIGEEMGIPILRGRLLSILHPLFKARSNGYAVALPRLEDGRTDLSRLRVFASDREDLAALIAQLRVIPWIRDYARLENPRQVPDDFAGPWKVFARYRIPTEKTDRKTGDEHGQLRRRRLQTAIDEKMDYFMLRSVSTGQSFTVIVRRTPLEEVEGGEHLPGSECLPNSYGFSVADRPFCLPDLP